MSLNNVHDHDDDTLAQYAVREDEAHLSKEERRRLKLVRKEERRIKRERKEQRRLARLILHGRHSDTVVTSHMGYHGRTSGFFSSDNDTPSSPKPDIPSISTALGGTDFVNRVLNSPQAFAGYYPQNLFQQLSPRKSPASPVSSTSVPQLRLDINGNPPPDGVNRYREAITPRSATTPRPKTLNAVAPFVEEVDKPEESPRSPIRIHIQSPPPTSPAPSNYSWFWRLSIWTCLGIVVLVVAFIILQIAARTSGVLNVSEDSVLRAHRDPLNLMKVKNKDAPVQVRVYEGTSSSILDVAEMDLDQLHLIEALRFAIYKDNDWITMGQRVASAERSSDGMQTRVHFMDNSMLIIDVSLQPPRQVLYITEEHIFRVDVTEAFDLSIPLGASQCKECPENSQLSNGTCLCDTGFQMNALSFTCSETLESARFSALDAESNTISYSSIASISFVNDPSDSCIGNVTWQSSSGEKTLDGPNKLYKYSLYANSTTIGCADSWRYVDSDNNIHPSSVCLSLRDYPPVDATSYIDILNTSEDVYWCVPDAYLYYNSTDLTAESSHYWGFCTTCPTESPTLNPTLSTPNPTGFPTSLSPTHQPTTLAPTLTPTSLPSTSAPTTEDVECIVNACQNIGLTAAAADDYCTNTMGLELCTISAMEQKIDVVSKLISSGDSILLESAFINEFACFTSNYTNVRLWTSETHSDCSVDELISFGLDGIARCEIKTNRIETICCENSPSSSETAVHLLNARKQIQSAVSSSYSASSSTLGTIPRVPYTD